MLNLVVVTAKFIYNLAVWTNLSQAIKTSFKKSEYLNSLIYNGCS